LPWSSSTLRCAAATIPPIEINARTVAHRPIPSVDRLTHAASRGIWKKLEDPQTKKRRAEIADHFLAGKSAGYLFVRYCWIRN
jgi:hypothetical protein